jgi:hypothetical protein
MEKQNKICPYRISKGNRSGQLCGSGVRGEAIYCAKHKQAIKKHDEAVNRMIGRQNELKNLPPPIIQ